MLAFDCQKQAFAIHRVLRCFHVWPEKKKKKKKLLSSESFLYARGAVSCVLLNMVTRIDVISYFIKPVEKSLKNEA